MLAIRSSIVELSQQCQSVWHRAIFFGERLAGNSVVHLRTKPDILRLDGQVLQASPLDPAWREHADDLAADWRDSGLEVNLIEHLSKPTAPGTYVLTARSETLALICTCQSWSDLATKEPVWTVGVSVRPVEQRIACLAGVRPLRHLGMVAAPTHEVAWEIVLAWLDSHKNLSPDILNMIGPAMPAVEANTEEYTTIQLTRHSFQFFGRASMIVAMIILLFFSLGGKRELDQTSELSSPLTDAGLSTSEPDDHSGDVQEIRATPAPSSPGTLASDSLMYAEQDPPTTSIFEAHEPKPEVQLVYAADSPVTMRNVNEPVPLTVTTNWLPPSSATLAAPALPEKMKVSLAVAPEPTTERANRSLARGSPPLPRAKPSNPITLGLVLTTNNPSSVIISQEIVSLGGGQTSIVENTLTKPLNPLEQHKREFIPTLLIARPGYAVQVAAVTTPAAASRVWSQTTARFPGLGNLRLLEPTPVEVGDKGRRLLYRVAAGAFKQRKTAEAVCNKVRARAGECLVISY